MREKEWTICIWIHHIATFIGLFSSLYHIAAGKKRPAARSGGLILFACCQAFGVFKIVADLAKGRSRLRKSFDNIHSLCRDKRQERGLLWVLTALSAVFKTSTPCLLK